MDNLLLDNENCSYYENVRSKRNKVITLAQFVTAIRNGRWKQDVENVRRLKAEGKLEEAEAIKSGMPGITSAGVFEGGHSKANVRTLSGEMMVDIDHYEGDVRQLIATLKAFPWVRAAWVSISGDGAKAEIRVDATSVEEYEKLAYPIVGRYLTRVLETPLDMACSDVSRMCYASYDPDAFYKDECEIFPWREKVDEFPSETETPDREDKPSGGTSTSATKKPASTAEGLVGSFLDKYLACHPYVRHHRHTFHLALGREARRAGMNESEFETLVSLAVSRLAMPDCDGPEIRRNLTDAYHFADLNQLELSAKLGSMGPLGSPVPFSGGHPMAEVLEETSARNHETRMGAPCLPDWIFEGLPDILAEGLTIAKDSRQRDMLFLSMMVNLSACMPGVKMLYDNTLIYPHLFLAVIASSASGKGIMAHAARLAYPVHQMLEKENEERQRRFEEQQLAWEHERQRAVKEKRRPDMKLRPEPVPPRKLIVPADVSRTRLIQVMSASPDGVLLNVSEMDTLRSALGAEYGRFDDLLRACFHHEMFGSDFKSDRRQYMVYSPKLAFCASGTPGQFYRLCPSMENGAYSRYLIYMAEQETEFRSMSPDGSRRTRNEVFLNLGGQVLDMYRFLKENPTEVKLTADQWDWHLAFFSEVLQRVQLEESEGPVSVVLRHGLSTARLAMIFTALRKFDSRWTFHEMHCSEDDFRRAMAVMEVLLHHSLMLSTTLQKEPVSPMEMRHYFRVQEALETLPSKFRYRELMGALCSSGIALTTAKRIRARLLDMKVIEQEGDMYHFQNRKWRFKLKKNRDGLGPV